MQCVAPDMNYVSTYMYVRVRQSLYKDNIQVPNNGIVATQLEADV
jgi:hypothetical protein